ncbi:MAG TPA: mechanosensitive ion channel domain-containing protein [Gemmataceae bacterium]|jgi:small conductance mechanosensitive channel
MQEAIWKSLTSRKVVVGTFVVLVLAAGGLWLVDPDAFPILGPITQAETPDPATDADAGPSLSAAERIARLQKSIDDNRKYLDRLQAELKDPNSEFKRAEKRFQTVDEQLQQARQEIQGLKDAGKTNEALARAESLKELQTNWQQNRERFDLAIKERKALQENSAALTRKIEEDQRALDRMSGAAPPAATATASGSSSTPTASSPSSPSSGGENEGKGATNDSAKSARTPAKTSSAPSLPGSPLSLAASTSSAEPATPTTDRVSREVERAKEEAKLKEEAAKKAENKAQSITERLESLQQNIASAERLLANARQRADHEQQTKNALDAELKQKTAANAPESERNFLSQRIEAAQRRFQEALADLRSATDHLHELEKERSTLQAAQIKAMHDADAKKHAAEAAEERIAWLQNPFRPRNIVQWLLHHGPRLVLIALGMLIFSRLSRLLSRRLVVLLSRGDTAKRGTRQDRENRAQTLVGVFSSALSLLVLGGGTLMILDEVGIPIVPLMGGAAVLGLAVAFGAQNLIKDYFSGFMVLLEDQYGINDVVRIGSISGLVEHISLRTTVLRDLEGVVHFIPHGTIATVSNLTHGWSRALFDVGVAYKEDVDRVMQVLLDMGRELRQDPAFGPLILDDPEMLGVDDLADSSVVIKFFLKTKPLQQWTVKREMLRRIKKRFDELGIEIPFPHQTVYHRYETPPPYAPPTMKRAG